MAVICRNIARFSWALALPLWSACVGDFMSETQVAAKIEAYQLSADVERNTGDGEVVAAADAAEIAAVPDGVAEVAETLADVAAELPEVQVDAAQDATAIADADADAGADAVCLASGATVDLCDGKDNDCDGQTDEDGCDDGNPCSAEDACVGGKCGGKPVLCDDKNPCTLDSCATNGASAGKCTHLPADGNPCDDDDLCTIGDACKDGGCKGALKTCSFAEYCIKSYCNPVDGKCVYAKKPAGIGCDDGNACTEQDICDTDGICGGKVINCDDGNPCTANSCNLASGCTATDSSAPCDDGNLCTIGDLCKGGVCASGQPLSCNDNNPCTTESCDAGKCKFVKNSQPCDDLTLCTSGDICTDGQCVGQPVDCDDKKVCTNDSCDAKSGCIHSAAAVLCDDGNTCTTLDHCENSVCIGVDQSAGLCDDGNPCTKDTCDAKTACAHAPLVGACDDGNPCTVGDVCDQNVCVPGKASAECVCATNADCKAKEDGNLCNGTLFCDKTANPPTCKVNQTTVVVCDDNANTECAKNTCDTKTGGCSLVAVADGKACDADSNACTVGDSCVKGNCAAGTAPVCDDKNPCTDDSCNPKVGCEANANLAPCDADGDLCTAGDQCASKVCVPGKPVLCDDKNPCTTDACVNATGKCTATPASGSACSDGDPCTLNDTCSNGNCLPSGTKQCDDGNPCTADSCSSADGSCVAAPKTGPCSDGNACTSPDTCTGGACSPGPTAVCNDQQPCTADTCDAATGKCVFTPQAGPCSDGNACTVGDACTAGTCKAGTATVCNDNNGCTNDSCDAASGLCVYAPNTLACDDKNACTTGDVCSAGQCKPGTWTCACTPQNEKDKCNDNNVCTEDKCLNNAGKFECKNLPDSGGTCSDGNPCSTNDICSSGVCVGNGVVDCDDKNACTADSCNPASGACTHTPAGDVCSDGNPCTLNDQCASGKCEAGPAKVCDDGKLCTTDACNLNDGSCQFVSNNLPCDDGNACTNGDTCGAGACKSGAPKVCSDGNPCTDDSCVPQSGLCVAVANAAPCNDSDKCTTGDVCGGGVCKGAAVVCNDNNPCTNDGCDANSGQCAYIANALPCDDGNKCTTNDACAASACKPGPLKNCADNTVCTDDSCDAATGNCLYAKNTKPCDDGSKCTANDVCSGGVCLPGTPTNCNDNNVCTDDLCDPSTGVCGFTANAKACNDGNACTDGDNCQGGSCVPGKFTCPCTQLTEAKDCNDQQACTQDKCVPTSGNGLACSNNPLTGTPCDDGNVCTTGEQCANGVCKAAANKVCDDGLVCTADSCDPVAGCKFTPVGGACSDNNPCTVGDLCSNGQCVGGAAKNCDDGNPCTNDSCDVSSGNCANVANTAACTDNNACTSPDQCSGGACKSGATKLCTDNNPCTDDSCNPANAACVFVNDNTNACNDGNACTLTDACDAGTCVGKDAKVCFDNNVCTNDGPCDPGTGVCAFPNNTASCEDGSQCTKNDTCSNGKCVGKTVDCNDANPCTTDTCAPASGCAHTNNTDVCDDGSKCTKNDTCANGNCVGTNISCVDGNPCTSKQCSPATGCVYTGNTGSGCKINDGCVAKALCNAYGGCYAEPACGYVTGDLCSVVACVSTSPTGSISCTASLGGVDRDCNDHNSCTADSCGKNGCAYSPTGEGSTCNNAGFVCKSGFCVPKQ